VADLRGKTFFAFYPGLNGIGHIVKGDDEPTEFRVIGRFEAGIEGASSNVTGSGGYSGKRAKQSATRTEAKKYGKESGKGGTDEKGSDEYGEGAFSCAKRERFEISGIAGFDVNTDTDVLLAFEFEELLP